jgi:clan AA aspartic protease
VIGIVDDQLRSLLEVLVGSSQNDVKTPLTVWIDTAFNGGLVLSRQAIEKLGLKEYSSTTAILADGQQVELATYTCYLKWFGNVYRTQVVANEGSFPLLGTMLLDGRELSINYGQRTLTLH